MDFINQMGTYKEIYGTNQSDQFDTYELNEDYPGYDGFEIYTYGGDDTVYSFYIGRNGVD